MKSTNRVRFFTTFVLVLSMLSPVATFAYGGNDKKYFKRGMELEAAEEWDKAVEQFALAVSESPKNPEYRLHLTRALFNASQQYMKKGAAAAKESDYESGYLAFRRAYAFDPTNELAKSEMERMVRLQKDKNEGSNGKEKDASGKVKLVQTGYTPPLTPGGPGGPVPQKLEKLRDIPFPTGIDLQFIIKELAKDLDLNVLFDKTSFRQPSKTFIDLKNVTAARALDYIFLQEGLFFQKVGPRTILVATQEQRTKFQQLVLRTFYLANAAPKDIAKVVQTAIPPQPGRSQTIVLTDDATNSVTIRDTEENIRLIGRLISSLDKDRAEVVMDVAIYEINKSDLLQLGNQIGTRAELTNLGGSSGGQVRLGSNPLLAAAAAAGAPIPTVIATGLLLPSAHLSLYSERSDTKLIASTQIHAFNNEDSSARIGQRVPVQSAQFVGVGSTTVGGNGVVSNVINYEQIGLTLKFKPLVFPNQDVQVAMEIESKDVVGAGTLTPTFTERTIKGTARIQNNKTLLLASVATGVETRGNSGLPLVGLIPIIGRLFTSPAHDNRHVDIVIAVTPRVIRAPAILPEDEIERSTGSLGIPTNNSLEAMIVDEEKEELLAAARRTPNTAVVQLPDRAVEAPEYVKADATSSASTGQPNNAISASNTTPINAANTPVKAPDVNSGPALKPIDSGVKTLQLNQTSDTSAAPVWPSDTNPVSGEPAEKKPVLSPVQLTFGTEITDMTIGQKVKIPVMLTGNGKFQSAVLGLRFDSAKVAVRSVTLGSAFGSASDIQATPFINQNGKMYVTLMNKDVSEVNVAGTLAIVEIEALKSGKPQIEFDRDVVNFLGSDGKNLLLKFEK